jgi:hypothetical protein
MPVMKWVMYPRSFHERILSSMERPEGAPGLPPTPYTITASALLSMVGRHALPVWKVVFTPSSAYSARCDVALHPNRHKENAKGNSLFFI